MSVNDDTCDWCGREYDAMGNEAWVIQMHPTVTHATWCGWCEEGLVARYADRNDLALHLDRLRWEDEARRIKAEQDRRTRVTPPADNWNPNTAGPDCDWCGECDWCQNLGRVTPPGGTNG